ncbi:hypothetical protein F5146DRAFT_758485 [Armillaria mellea]|nr:hypothetical protein F5146DRAFT_758485 [Armillaria mellea]
MNKRRHLQQYVTAHQGILSPIRAFPSEILAEIFIQTLDGCYDVFDTKRGPWVFGHVCRGWKDISRSCPALWTSLSIESLHLQPESRRSHLPDILKEVLSLSRNRQLDVRYSLQSLVTSDRNAFRPDVLWVNRNSDFWDILQQLLDLLVNHSMRWKSAAFDIPAKLGRRLEKAKGRLPSLVRFDLSVCQGLEVDGPFHCQLLDALSVAPTLKVLTVTSAPKMLLSFSWSQMRRLRHDVEASVEEHLRLLTEAPLLETYMAGVHDVSPWESHSLHCTHRSLRRLELSFRDSSPTLLQYLTCPALEKLSLESYTLDDFSQVLYEFGDRSGCPLRQLSVKVLEDAGNLLPFLDSLASKKYGWSHDLFPGLAVFKLIIEEDEGGIPSILGRLANIIRARWNPGSCDGLQSLSIVIDSDTRRYWDTETEYDECQFDILQQFKEAGFNVTLRRNGKQEV